MPTESTPHERVGVALLVSALLFIGAYGLGALLPGARDGLLIAWGLLAAGLVLIAYGGAS